MYEILTKYVIKVKKCSERQRKSPKYLQKITRRVIVQVFHFLVF